MFVELILVFALTEPLIVKAKFPVSPVKLDLDTGKYESYKIVPSKQVMYLCSNDLASFNCSVQVLSSLWLLHECRSIRPTRQAL